MIKPLYHSYSKNSKSSKKMLLICATIFSFPVSIADTFSKKGFDVFWFDDRPSRNPFIKAMIRLNRKSIHLLTRLYLKKIISFGHKENIDFIFIVDGQAFLKKDILLLRKNFPHCRFVFSTLDSIHNFSGSLDISSVFDKAYSFDEDDSKKYPVFNFLPDFYTEDYSNIEKKPIKYDFFYFGTAHPKKVYEIEKMANQLQEFGLRGHIYQFLPSHLVFVYNKITSHFYKKKRINDFHYSPLSTKDICLYFSESNIIIDSPAAGQSGLTPRSISAMAAGKKLITTNPNITHYDFYRPENVYFAKNGQIDFSDLFFHSEYVTIPEAIIKKYSIDAWCDEIIS
jgi:hypothetical protein